MSTDQTKSGASNRRVPFKEGFLTDDLSDLGAVRLTGSRCNSCKVVLLGKRRRCENCSSDDLSDAVFSDTGTVYSYTIQRYPPPPPHAGPDSWVVRGLAWVDVNDGPRILAPVKAKPEQLSVGMKLRFACEVGWHNKADQEVVSYYYTSADGER